MWSGERSHDNDLNRSIPLATLKPLLDLPNVAFVSLQHEVRAEDLPLLRSLESLGAVCAIGGQFKDFADTAAAIAQLDAVIAVDTAVAHLVGAMGKPLFLLLPFAADFRWLRERGGQPVVSERAAVSSTAIRRLGQCRRAIATRIGIARQPSGQGGLSGPQRIA